MTDDRMAHDHPRHSELMLPCYPACQTPQDRIDAMRAALVQARATAKLRATMNPTKPQTKKG